MRDLAEVVELTAAEEGLDLAAVEAAVADHDVLVGSFSDEELHWLSTTGRLAPTSSGDVDDQRLRWHGRHAVAR